MTAQSWVETTLPPGYVAHVIRPGVHEFFYGHSGNRWGYASHSETCRSAWRHWTAAVLRGRDVEWVSSWCVDMKARCGQASIIAYATIGSPAAYSAWIYQGEACAGPRDVQNDADEAMARFAALVLATEGPAMKGGK